MRRFINAGPLIAAGLLLASTDAQAAAAYRQVLAPVTGSLSWSALVAVLPLATLFVLLGGLRWPARWAALAALSAACLIAALVYGMPAGQVVSGAAEGAASGFFPIIWIGINAIWVYDLTEASGHSHVLRRAFGRLSDDPRVLAILVAFCFGTLLESLAGGGAPVAICGAMLISLGSSPLQAAAVCLIADTSPVAFGSLGLPITVLSTVTGLPVHSLSLMIGRQTPFLALIVPFILLVIMDGRRGLRQVWPVALVAGLSFAAGQSAGSALLPVELVDIIAALFSCGVTIAFLRIWTAAAAPVPQPLGAAALEANSGLRAQSGPRDTRRETLRALAPYLLVLLVVALVQARPVATLLGQATSTFSWPGLSVESTQGRPVAATTAKFEWLLSAGSLVLLAGALSAPVLGIKLVAAARLYIRTLRRLRWAIATVCFVVGLAFVMNLSGQTTTLGVWAAGAGPAFAAISPVIGWFGTALTGSDTSTNALFGVLQVTTARATGVSDILLAAANSAGGVCGKAVSPQNLAIAAVAVGVEGREGELFRRVVGWTLLMIGSLAGLVFLQSTPLLSWMVP